MPGANADIASIAALFAERARARILLALVDGRALPASVLAAEAGVSAPATSAHLAKLRAAGLITVEPAGRHRYHRLAGPAVADAIEALSALAPAEPVRSLRQHTAAAALRRARTCYDHLAGLLGVTVTTALVERGALCRADGVAGTDRRPTDPLSAAVPEHPYVLGPQAGPVLAALGVDVDAVADARSRRPLLRFCTDWTEQRHHLAGRLGAAVLDALLRQGWVAPTARRRALAVTDLGERELHERLGIALPLAA
ncbi:helix-turn-helix domain-containing protein [Actinomycetes bacterium KLBMP 9759]